MPYQSHNEGGKAPKPRDERRGRRRRRTKTKKKKERGGRWELPAVFLAKSYSSCRGVESGNLVGSLSFSHLDVSLCN